MSTFTFSTALDTPNIQQNLPLTIESRNHLINTSHKELYISLYTVFYFFLTTPFNIVIYENTTKDVLEKARPGRSEHQ